MKNRVCRLAVRACMIALGFAALRAPAQTQVLETYGTSLTSYLAAASPNQGVLPLFTQRGVGLDGTMISPPTFSWAMNGNPFGDSWVTAPRVNDFQIINGTYSPTVVDWSGPTPGAANWVIARSYNQVSAPVNDRMQGHGWFQMSQPELSYFKGTSGAPDVVYLVYGADRYLEFVQTSSATLFKGKNGAAGFVQYVSGTPDTYVYTDQLGTQTSFFGGNTSSHRADWQVWKIVDTTGNTSYVGDSSSAATATTSGYNSNKTISVAYDASASQGRRFSYAYTTVGSVSRLQTVTVEVLTSGTWTSSPVTKEIARVTYGYSSGLKLPDGYLLTSEVRTSLTDSGTSLSSGIYLAKTTYYRYYDDTWSNSTGRRGNVGMLKLVLSPEGARNYDWSKNGVLDGDYAAASDSDLQPYSAAYFEYPSSGSDWRPNSAFFNGECGCSGASGTFGFTYDDSSTRSASVANTTYDTSWATRTVMARPDGSYDTYYSDETGAALSKVLTASDPAFSVASALVTQVIRNGSGQVTDIRSPMNNTGYYHVTGGGHNAGDMSSDAAVGLVTTIDRVSSGDMTGFPEATRVQPGTGGTNTYVTWKSYTSTDYQYSSGKSVIRPLISAMRSYHDESSTTNSAKYDETDMAYTVWGSTNASPTHLSLKTIQTTYPFVSLAKYGRGTSASHDEPIATQYLRTDGTIAFNQDTTYYDDLHAMTPVVRVQYTQLDANNQSVTRVLDKKAESSWSGSYPSADNPSNWSLTLESGVGSGGNAIDAIVSSGATYDAQGRPDEVTVPYVGGTRIIKNYYSVLADGRTVTLVFPEYTSAPLFKGPATYTISNLLGKTEFTGTVAITSSGLSDALTTWIDETDSNPVTAIKKGTLATERRSIYSNSGTQLAESRLYTSISGPSYDATTYGYDGYGRLIRTQDPDTTIHATTYDAAGRASTRSIGTDDAGANNMTKIQALSYDANSRLTTRIDYVQDPTISTSDQRETDMHYDYRGRLIAQVNPLAPHSVFAYDNLGRVLSVAQYSSNSPTLDETSVTSTTTNRTALNETAYNERGQVYKTTRHNITQATGVDFDSISSLFWYDSMGHRVKTRGEQNAKSRYDRLSRRTNGFNIAIVDEADSGATNAEYLDAFDVTGDKVLEESQTYFDDKTSLPLMSVLIQRHPNDTSTTGPLDTDTDLSKLDYTNSHIKGRAQISWISYDHINRATYRGMVGTHNGTDFDRDTDTSTTPSNTNLLTNYTYNDDGTVLDITDPRGKVTRTLYDDAQRKIATIADYLDGTPSGDNGDDDVYTRYEYTNGHMTKMYADLNGTVGVSGTDQPTFYIYGSTKGTPSEMKIATGGLLRAIKYPDTGNGGTTVAAIDGDSSTVVSYAYNAQGQQTFMEDAAGTKIDTDYDTAGRQVQRRAGNIASGLDTTVQRIATVYLPRGLVDTVTQYDDPNVGSGTVQDQVKFLHDGWGNVSTIEQDMDSIIGGSGRSSLDLSYGYAKSSGAGGRVTIYCNELDYPDGTKVVYGYGTSGSIAEGAVRVSKLTQNSVDLASYDYLGAGQVVTTTLNEAGTNSSVFNSGSTTYPDYDNFNRVTESIWTRSRNFYDVAISYDRDSGITQANDGVLTDINGNHQFDTVFTNDSLNRLTEAKEGAATTTSITTCLRDEQWTLSQTGNWANHVLDNNCNGTITILAGDLNDTGTFDTANKWNTRDIDTNGSPNYTLAYDGNGSMTDDGQSYKYVWDAFGRLVTVKNQSSAVVANYRYNGLGQRIAWQYDTTDGSGGGPDKVVNSNDPTFFFVYDLKWRIVQTYRGSDAHPKERFVFHNAGANGIGGGSYIDLVVLRDRDMSVNWFATEDYVGTTMGTRIYYAQNWRADMVAITDENGLLIENIRHSAYGRPSSFALADVNHDGVINGIGAGTDYAGYFAMEAGSGGNADTNFDGSVGSGQDDTDFSDSYTAASTGGIGVLSRAKTDNRIGYAGYQYDPVTKLYLQRHRDYSPDKGRWLSKDPLGYRDDMNLYQYLGSGPMAGNDPTGMCRSQSRGAPQFFYANIIPPEVVIPSAKPVHVILPMPPNQPQDPLPPLHTAPIPIPDYDCPWIAHCLSGGGSVGPKSPDEYTPEDPSESDCGAGLLDPLIPNNPFGFKFMHCCVDHDQCYVHCQLGDPPGGCNDAFCDCTSGECDSQGTWIQRHFCRDIAWLYCHAVRTFGDDFYCSSQEKACKCITHIAAP